MVKSMTGYGRGEYSCSRYDVSIELKAVNHRYNDIAIHMPRYMSFLEDNMKKLIRKNIKRGRIDIYVDIEETDESAFNIDVNLPLAKEYKKALEKIRLELDIEKEIDLKDVISGPDMINVERKTSEDDKLWKSIEVALGLAIDEALNMKILEGQNLKEDMLIRLDNIQNKVDDLEKIVPIVISEYKEKLEVRLEELLRDDKKIKESVDQYILANEVANFAEKSDVSEEITRLRSHLDQYKSILEEDGVIGRKLDFLIQEINREINTIGSKSGDVKIVQEVVYVKSEIEKLREQVQNIE